MLIQPIASNTYANHEHIANLPCYQADSAPYRIETKISKMATSHTTLITPLKNILSKLNAYLLHDIFLYRLKRFCSFHSLHVLPLRTYFFIFFYIFIITTSQFPTRSNFKKSLQCFSFAQLISQCNVKVFCHVYPTNKSSGLLTVSYQKKCNTNTHYKKDKILIERSRKGLLEWFSLYMKSD